MTSFRDAADRVNHKIRGVDNPTLRRVGDHLVAATAHLAEECAEYVERWFKLKKAMRGGRAVVPSTELLTTTFHELFDVVFLSEITLKELLRDARSRDVLIATLAQWEANQAARGRAPLLHARTYIDALCKSTKSSEA